MSVKYATLDAKHVILVKDALAVKDATLGFAAHAFLVKHVTLAIDALSVKNAILDAIYVTHVSSATRVSYVLAVNPRVTSAKFAMVAMAVFTASYARPANYTLDSSQQNVNTYKAPARISP